MIDVVLSFPSRSAASRAAARTAEAVAEGLIDIRAAAVVWVGRRGRTRIAHGLPLTRSQRAEHTLVGLAPLVGVPVDLVPSALGALPDRLPAHVLDQVRTLLPTDRVALAVRLGGAPEDAPVLCLAELARGRVAVGVVTTTLELTEAALLEAALP